MLLRLVLDDAHTIHIHLGAVPEETIGTLRLLIVEAHRIRIVESKSNQAFRHMAIVGIAIVHIADNCEAEANRGN